MEEVLNIIVQEVLLSAGSEEPNGIVQLESGNVTEPNRRVTEVLLYEGLTATSQNRWPNIKFDLEL